MYKTIVCGTDGSATAGEAVRQAADLAQKLGARMHLVSAYRVFMTPAAWEAVSAEGVAYGLAAAGAAEANVDLAKETESMLSGAAEEVRKVGVEVTTHAVAGDAADAILDVAEAENADLIVVGNRGMSGAKRFLLGSVSNKVTHHAPCNVLIVHTT